MLIIWLPTSSYRIFFHFISCRGLNSDKVGLTCILFIFLLYVVHCHVNNIAEAHLYNVMIPTGIIVKYLPNVHLLGCVSSTKVLMEYIKFITRFYSIKYQGISCHLYNPLSELTNSKNLKFQSNKWVFLPMNQSRWQWR